jgi:hypothetical protein
MPKPAIGGPLGPMIFGAQHQINWFGRGLDGEF